jgi:phosphoenolpyruvate-protein phosphotransferase
MRSLHGIAVSPGVAVGPWIRVDAGGLPAGGTVPPAFAAAEVARLVDARDEAALALEQLAARLAAEGSTDESAIFEAQAAMARDPELLRRASERIATGADAVAAIGRAAESFAAELRALDDAMLAARDADILDVARRIVAVLDPAAVAPSPRLDEPSIVVAQDLAPSTTATLPRDRLLGIALAGGSPTAHAAILARGYGIPAVVSVAGLLDALGSDGDHALALDGTTGVVVLDPDSDTRTEFGRRAERARRRERDELAEARTPVQTTDGLGVTLLANIGSPADAPRARLLGAAGVGLFRTEFLFLERSEPPSEDEQVAAYRSVIDAFTPHPVTIRLLDVGGDKPIPYLRLPPEANPFLGVRALRLADQRPELFVTQLRAAMRAAAGAEQGTVKVMAPMVADALDVELLLELAREAEMGLERDRIPHGQVAPGVMLEIPSAILTAATYVDRIAFASIGTNDLSQYTLAADRGNANLSRFQDALHPAVLRLVAMAVEAARTGGIELSVCGELAGEPAGALALVGLGVDRLSMAAPGLADVRRAIRAASAAGLRRLAEEAQGLADAAAVRARFAPLVEMPSLDRRADRGDPPAT